MSTSDPDRTTSLTGQEPWRFRLGHHRWRAIVNTVVAFGLALIFVWPFLCIVGATLNRIDVWMNPLLPIPAQFSTKLYEPMVQACLVGRVHP